MHHYLVVDAVNSQSTTSSFQHFNRIACHMLGCAT